MRAVRYIHVACHLFNGTIHIDEVNLGQLIELVVCVALTQDVHVDVLVEEAVYEGAKCVLEEMRDEEEDVTDGQAEEIDTGWVDEELLLGKDEDGEAVADDTDDDEDRGGFDIELARSLEYVLGPDLTSACLVCLVAAVQMASWFWRVWHGSFLLFFFIGPVYCWSLGFWQVNEVENEYDSIFLD